MQDPERIPVNPLPDFALDEIILERKKYEDKREKYSDGFNDLDFICCNETGKPYNCSFKDKPFKRLLDRLGIRGFHWHDLRHTYATVLNDNQVNLKAISMALGHKKPEFSEKVYIAREEPVFDIGSIMETYARTVLPEVNNDILEIKFAPNFLAEILPQ